MQAYQDYIHVSKYSRYLETHQRRETWEETVKRYIDFWIEKYPDIDMDWDMLETEIILYNAMPSMRALMTSGKALSRDSMAGYNCAAASVSTPRIFDEAFYILMCFHPDTMIKVKGGDKKISDLTTDDFVMTYDEKNEVFTYEQVRCVFENATQDKQKVRLWFDNDTQVVCTHDHRFLTHNRGYVEARHLNENDDIVSMKMIKREYIEQDGLKYYDINLPPHHNYVLANGAVVHNCGTGFGFSVERKYTEQLPVINDDMFESETVLNVADSKLGWAGALKELIAMLYTGNIPKWDLSKIRPAGARLKTFGGRACLTGDTILYKDRKKARGYNEITIKDLFDMERSQGKWKGKPNHFRDVKLRSLDEETGQFYRNNVITVIDNGVAPVYEILTENGYRIKATGNHRFMRETGDYDYVDNFNVGDLIAVNGSTEKKTDPYSHKYLSYDKIISIEYAGEEQVYDLQMEAPNHNFVANGFVSHNSGPEPLNQLFHYTVRTFKNAKSRKLTSLECHDLICQIAKTVIVGSVRRSACISFSNLSDTRMKLAKSGNWQDTHEERNLSNNSVMYTCKPDLVSYLDEFQSLYLSKCGERGFVNQEALQKKANECGREYEGYYLLNPCVTGDTMLLTDKGYFPINELVDQDVNMWNGNQWSPVKPFSTGVNDLMEITFSNGSTIRCTPYHRFILEGKEDMVEAKNLDEGDKLKKVDMPVIEYGTYYDEPYSQGFYAGDGEDGAKASKLYSPKFCCADYLSGEITTYNESYSMWKHGDMMPRDFVPINGARNYCVSWLSGILDADGHIQKNPNSINLIITSINHKFLNDIRLMLSRLGVQAKVCDMKPEQQKMMPDGKGDMKEYNCQKSYRLVINAVDVETLKGLGLKCNRLDLECNVPNRDARRFITVVSIKTLAYKEETFCVTEEKRNQMTIDGIVTGNCGEAILRDTGQLCNLSEIIARSGDPLDVLKHKAMVATIFGTLQSGLTDFRYIRKIWTDNALEDPLLGVSITGVMDHSMLNGKAEFEKGFPILRKWLRELKQVVVDTNIEWAEKLGIKPATQLTLIKPSGTVSQLVNCSSGMHPRHSKYILRKVAQDVKDPLSQLMIDQGVPYYEYDNKYYFKFPIKVPDNSVCIKDVDPIYQLELWKVYQEEWCDGNPSQTIYYDDNSFLSLQMWVWENWDSVGGLSFFPKDDNVYANAPYNDITEDEYNELIDQFPLLDFTQLSNYENGDQTTGTKEFACSGATGCEL